MLNYLKCNIEQRWLYQLFINIYNKYDVSLDLYGKRSYGENDMRDANHSMVLYELADDVDGVVAVDPYGKTFKELNDLIDSVTVFEWTNVGGYIGYRVFNNSNLPVIGLKDDTMLKDDEDMLISEGFHDVIVENIKASVDVKNGG